MAVRATPRPAHADAAQAVVDGELPVDESLGLGPAPERRLDARHELGWRERLDDVVGRAALERPCDGLVPAVAGDEDDREIGQLRDLLHQLDPVRPGEHQVEEDEARLLGAGTVVRV